MFSDDEKEMLRVSLELALVVKTILNSSDQNEVTEAESRQNELDEEFDTLRESVDVDALMEKLK